MEIFVRLFVWTLNLTYGRRGPTSLYRKIRWARWYCVNMKKSKKKDLVEEFKSAAA
jgi:hypothetical protein